MSPTLQIPTAHVNPALLTAAQRKIQRAAERLLSLQHDDGYWCALLTADTTLESDYILLQLWMYSPGSAGEKAGAWNPPDRGKIDRAAERILSKQLPDGGFNIYVKGPSEISASVNAHDPKRPVPAGFNLDEIFIPGRSTSFEGDDSWLSWRKTFVQSDKILKLWDRYGYARIRQAAIRKCEHWMLERMKHADGLGAIYPPMQYAIMALDVLGYAADNPVRMEAVRQFENLIVDDGKTFFFQPCFSPVWDTAIAAYSLGEAGLSGSPALSRAADWLLAREIRRNGDWSVKRPWIEPSGWAFEFQNDWYPDIDDTAMVMLSFPHMKAGNSKAQSATRKRALDWLLAMQSKDGGWAAFDVDNNWAILTHVPFADHNAMLDPTCADITGRTLEALAVNRSEERR